MYPDLSYLFHSIIGTQPDNWLSIFKTFGFFLALSFLVSAIVFYIELKRKAKEGGFFEPTVATLTEGAPATMGEIAANAFAGLLLGGKGLYAYQHYADFRVDPASIILSTKMHWVAGIIGAVLLAALTWWDSHRRALNPPLVKQVNLWPHDRISELTVSAAVGGIVGAKLFDVFDNWDSFIRDPIGSLTSGGGLAFFGGLVLGFVAVVFYMYRHKISFLPAADAVAPSLTAGYGFGRIGCQLSGDGDWGIVNAAPKPNWMGFLPDWLWADRYPHHVLDTENTDPVQSIPIDGCTWDYCMQLSQPVFPTPLYEVMMMSAIFGILWALRKRIHTPGLLFCIYLCLIGVERFIIEKIRVNVVHDVMGFKLTQAEIISIALFCIGLVGAALVLRRKKA